MIVTNSPEMRTHILDSIRARMVQEREGIHLSDLIYCSRKAYWKKQHMQPTPGDDLCILWMTGYAFQSYMFPLDEEITQVIDGISCTPDIHRGIEVKSTRQSSKYFNLHENQAWQIQILGYCKALDKLEYDLVVLFLMGSYAPPFPRVDCWHITTTQEEVDTNWVMVTKRRDILINALLTVTPPEPDCFDWEWKYCDFIDLCTDTVCYRKHLLKKDKKEIKK
jgi:hypothetical protein